VPQSASTVQVNVGSFAQVPVMVVGSMTQVSIGIWHVTKPGLPQVERAAQRTNFPLQFVGRPCATSVFTL